MMRNAPPHTTVCTSYVAAVVPRWLESFQIGLVSPSIRYLFSQFLQSGIRQRKVVVTMRNAPPHTTVCTSIV